MLNQYVSYNWRPNHLQQVGSGCFVAKDPLVFVLWIEIAPVLLTKPLPGFIRVREPEPAHTPGEDPVIQVSENLFRHVDPEVVRPTSEDRIDLAQYLRDVLPL